MVIGFFRKPPACHRPEIVEIIELPRAQEVSFDILERGLDLPFGLGPSPRADDGTARVVGDKGGERRIEDRSTCFPAQNHSFLAVIEALSRNPTKMAECILMSPDQREEVTTRREVDELPTGKPKDIGKTLNFLESFPLESDLVWAPVHLSLLAWTCFKANYRLDLAFPRRLEIVAKDGDTTIVALDLQFLIHAQATDGRELLQKLTNSWFEGIELARPHDLSRKDLVIRPIFGMIPENATNGVSGDFKKTTQGTNRRAVP